MDKAKLKISVGIPAFNAEKTIEKTIKSILNQTIQDFEVIISDNSSKDKTLEICKKYGETDTRFKIFSQKKNMGPYWNFDFVLQKAQGEYFVWFAVDDEHEETFLEKNLIALEKDKNLVGSISDVKYFGGDYIENIKESYFQKFKNKFKYKFDKRSKFIQTFPAYGTYEKKSTLYLRMDRSTSLYSVFRKIILEKSMIVTPFAGSDLAIILNVLKHGDINVVDEILMKKYLGGYSSNGIISCLKNQNTGKMGMMCVNLPFTIWCAKNLGRKIFFKNLDWFIIINIYGVFLISSDLIQILKKRLSK